jgi:hypothetical protein
MHTNKSIPVPVGSTVVAIDATAAVGLTGAPQRAELEITVTESDVTFAFIAKRAGVHGNSYSVEILFIEEDNVPLTIEIQGTKALITLETDGDSAVVTAVDDLATALAVNEDFNRLFRFEVREEGADVLNAVPETALEGGTESSYPLNQAVTGAYLRIEGADVRIKLDGTDPTTTEGILLPEDTFWDLLRPDINYIELLRNMRLIATSGSGTVSIECFK